MAFSGRAATPFSMASLVNSPVGDALRKALATPGSAPVAASKAPSKAAPPVWKAVSLEYSEDLMARSSASCSVLPCFMYSALTASNTPPFISPTPWIAPTDSLAIVPTPSARAVGAPAGIAAIPATIAGTDDPAACARD